MKKQLLIVSGVAAAVLVAALVACKASITTGPNVPVIGGSNASVEVDPLGKTGSVPPQTGLPAGACVTIRFYDANGGTLGSTTTTVGESFNIPPGATGGRLDLCEGPGGGKKKKKRRGGRSTLHLEQFGYAYIPFDLTSGPYHYSDFWVTAPDREQADQLADDFIFGLLSEPPPLGVHPQGVVEVQVEPDGSVRVTMFSTSEPASLSFEWNHAPLYDLDDASVLFANGWFLTTVHVPSSLVDVDLLGTSDNSLQYSMGLSSGDEVGTSVSVSVTQ